MRPPTWNLKRRVTPPDNISVPSLTHFLAEVGLFSWIYDHNLVTQNVPCLRCIEVNNATIAIVVLPYIAWAGGSKIHLGSKHL